MINDLKFVYDAPDNLFFVTRDLLGECLTLEKQRDYGSLISKQMIFIVMIAIAIESHINWYYYFQKGIDLRKNKMSIEEKRKNLEIKSDNQEVIKGAIKAIFKLRDDLVHIKYNPRKVQSENLYGTYIMGLSFDTLINLRYELTNSYPETLDPQIKVNSSEKELLSGIKVIKDETGKKINWVELVLNGNVGLPMLNKVHIE